MTSQQQHTQLSPIDDTIDAAFAVSRAVKSTKYALCGGAACIVLGSKRQTGGVDVVVPKGCTPIARADLKKHPSFKVEPRTNYTTFIGTSDHSPKNPVPINILVPPGLFKYDYTGEDSQVLLLDGVALMHPLILLASKVESIQSRRSNERCYMDAQDIVFLLQMFKTIGKRVEMDEVPGLSADKVERFIQFIPESKELFRDVGLLE